jgi:serine/threonine protein kinase
VTVELWTVSPMEATPTAALLAQLAVRLGLVSTEQMQEARDEAGIRTNEPYVLLGVLKKRGLLTPWQADKLLKGDTEGYVLGGYRILYKIASGSFGRVFRADDPRSGLVVAIKVLRRRWSDDTQRIDLFAREARVGLQLKHPNIVEVLATNQDPTTKQYYIVMEFVEGWNLREMLETRKALSVSDSLKLLEDAAAGLAYAHSRGVTHRDVKPTNILVASAGAAKLVDFGLAGIAERAAMSAEHAKDHVERTVDYAGLERATNVKTGDTRSDIFFLGVVLFEMLTGRSPLLTTRDKNQRMQKQRFDNIALLRPGEVQGPPSLFALQETMLALDPARRYQTPAQLVDAVKTVRREVEGPAAAGAVSGGPASTATRTLYIVERDERWQDALREKFKEAGFKVMLAVDPTRALERFRQQPFQALIIDANSVGEDGLMVFEQVMLEAVTRSVACAGVLILNEEQADWQRRVTPRPGVGVMVLPIKFKQLHRKLVELMGAV